MCSRQLRDLCPTAQRILPAFLSRWSHLAPPRKPSDLLEKRKTWKPKAKVKEDDEITCVRRHDDDGEDPPERKNTSWREWRRVKLLPWRRRKKIAVLLYEKIQISKSCLKQTLIKFKIQYLCSSEPTLLQNCSGNVPEMLLYRHLVLDREGHPEVPCAERIEAREHPGGKGSEDDSRANSDPHGAIEGFENVPHGVGTAGTRQQDGNRFFEQRISEIDNRCARAEDCEGSAAEVEDLKIKTENK